MFDEETLNQYIKSYQLKIEERIFQVSKIEEPVSLYEPYKYIMAEGGKRIRPLLVMIAADAVGSDALLAIDAAVAVEILHNFTLVHDDIMDKSTLRRGRQTVHTKWNESVAILLGDLMIGKAYELLPKNEYHKRADKIHHTFNRGLIEVCEGQGLDVEFDGNMNVTLADYLNMIEKKTSRLLETAVVIGANFGYGKDVDIKSLRQFANYLGIAFQIQDDLLDLTASTASFGKRTGQDLIDGKITFLIVKAMEKIKDDSDKILLNNFFFNHGINETEIENFKNLFEKYDIFMDAESEANKYFELAKLELNKLENNKGVEMLLLLTNKLNKRDK
jgi:geranylgeranyl diphosphate synthase, type II